MTRWLWQAADGSITDLSAWSSGTYVLTDGTSGELAPTYEFAEQQFAGIDGAAVQQITAGPAHPVLGLDLVDDGTGIRDRVRALTHVLRPRAGIGALQAVGDDGTVRSLPCYYRKGLEAGRYQAARFRAALEFYAPSPWWRGAPVSYSWTLAPSVPFFPILPLQLSASSVSGQVTIDLSDTDAPTFPRIAVLGPGTTLQLSNTYLQRQADGSLESVTQSLALNANLSGGQGLAIDTRPGAQSVKAATLNTDGTVAAYGADMFSALQSDPALWALVDGVNTVTATLAGATSASRIWVTADRLYSGAR